jgi:hypothetical protein
VRDLGSEQYLNRLHEFFVQQFGSNSSTSLLRSELEHLAVFLRRLNDMASKGVHAQVSALEARQGLVGVYMFLSNVIAKLDSPRTGEDQGIGRDAAGPDSRDLPCVRRA